MSDRSWRAARSGDLPAIESFLRAAGLPTSGVAEHLGDFLLVERGGRIAACGALERYAESALLRSIAVAESARSEGFGSAVVGRLIARARSGGAEDVVLLTTTAAEWFPRFGFTAIPRDEAPEAVRGSAEFREACPASAVAMRLRLA